MVLVGCVGCLIFLFLKKGMDKQTTTEVNSTLIPFIACGDLRGFDNNTNLYEVRTYNLWFLFWRFAKTH